MTITTECSICGYEYQSAKRARDCEEQGVKENKLAVGDRFRDRNDQRVIYEVVELLPASHITHNPGVRVKIVEGNLDYLFIGGRTPESFIFDEASIIDRILPRSR